MHNGDANFKTLTPRILNLEQNIKGNDFVLHMSHSSIVYNKYVLYVCTVCMYSTYGFAFQYDRMCKLLIFRSIKNLLLV